jgi:hypothetical protein
MGRSGSAGWCKNPEVALGFASTASPIVHGTPFRGDQAGNLAPGRGMPCFHQTSRRAPFTRGASR